MEEPKKDETTIPDAPEMKADSKKEAVPPPKKDLSPKAKFDSMYGVLFHVRPDKLDADE